MTPTTKLNWSEMSARDRDIKVQSLVMDQRLGPQHYTTEIRPAFMVIEKLRAEGFVVRLDNGLDGTWECTFYEPRAGGQQHYAPANTLPESICLAALRAKGVEV